MVTPLRIGALFAGYGGLDMAVESVLDAEVSWVSEFDTHPSRILAHRYPHAPNLGDVTKIDWAAVEPVDVITGGSPCQDLSHAGKRAGMKSGTRSGLWASMCDAIDIIRPRLVLWENVRGALSAEATAGDVESCELCVGDDGRPSLRALGRVLGDLAEIGYDAAWTGLRAADVGAPHGRFRIFVLAWPAADADDGVHGQHRSRVAGAPASRERWDAGADRGSADRGRGVLAGGSREWRDLTLLPSPRTSDTNGAGTHGTGGLDLRTAVSLLHTPRATDGTKGGPNQRGSSGDLMLPSAVTLLPTPRATRGGSGTETMYELGAQRSNEERTQGVVLLPTPSVADVEGGRKGRSGARSDELLLNGIAAEQRWGEYAPAIARWEAVLGRPAPDPTEQDWERWERQKRSRLASKKPVGMRGSIRFILDGPPHRLSPRFVEWMMGLSSGWVTDPAIWEGMKPSTARNAQLTALGNGVVPQQAAAALRWMLEVRRAVTG